MKQPIWQVSRTDTAAKRRSGCVSVAAHLPTGLCGLDEVTVVAHSPQLGIFPRAQKQPRLNLQRRESNPSLHDCKPRGGVSRERRLSQNGSASPRVHFVGRKGNLPSDSPSRGRLESPPCRASPLDWLTAAPERSTASSRGTANVAGVGRKRTSGIHRQRSESGRDDMESHQGRCRAACQQDSRVRRHAAAQACEIPATGIAWSSAPTPKLQLRGNPTAGGAA